MRHTGLAHYLRNFEHQGGIIVCEERKFIYMKPPRTGGTSILRNVLEPAIPGIIHCKDKPHRFTKWLHQLTDEQLDDYFVFSVVRNPWDRFVSIAAYFRLSVDQLVRQFEQYRRRNDIRVHSLPLYGYTHFAGAARADFIGRFEDLQSSFERICDRIGIAPRRLPHASRTMHGHYSQYYDSHTKDQIAHLYTHDIEAFRYQFEAD